MVSLMIYASFIYRLMTQKLPRESLRPGMFISVGPSAFTVSGIVNMGRVLPRVVPADFMGNGPLAGEVARIVATWMGLWLWGLALWFFLVSVGAHWSTIREGKMTFAMTWYSYVFPNTGELCLRDFRETPGMKIFWGDNGMFWLIFWCLV
jgi:tellurite resistance protein TehA-like permease